jgi:tetratricopeptide (TPR) repeat protein
MSVATLHVSLTEHSQADVELRYWRDDQRQSTPRELGLAEIANLARRSEGDYYAIPAPDLEAVGRRLYRWLDGSDRWLARELEALGGAAVALAIECRGRLAHLPWETLHDGTAFLVRAANPAVLPVRWQRRGPAAAAPENRALNVLFMATSPLGVQPELNFEEEEGRILAATRTYPLALQVEETGTLKEMGDLVRGYPEGHFDVLHLTGHADHRPEGPRFLTESASGAPEWVSAADVAREVSRKPRLTFLSGCRTGQSLSAGAVPSLAEDLLGLGFPAVLGWGRPVLDADATAAAAAVYDRLAAGFTPVEAVLHAHAEMERGKAKHWHLLRFFVAGPLPLAPVSPPRTPGRRPAPPPTSRRRFLSKKDNTTGSVVDRQDFVGRRRPLQRFVRALRGGDRPAGVVVHGLGGVGKSSLACRLCDRLDDFEPAVHVGVLDEPALLRTLEQLDGSAEERRGLQGTNEPLRHRLRAFLRARQDAGRKKLLLVLDDFEQNTPLDGGQPLITVQAQEVLEALVWAVEQTGAARCLITSRYKLTTSQAGLFYQEELSALRQAEAEKKRRALAAYREASPGLRAGADRVADSNPRLMERLDRVLGLKGLDHAGILQRLEAAAVEFREQILVGELLAGLPGQTRQCLAGMLVYELPVPFEAVAALFPDRDAKELQAGLDAAAALGLVEQEPEGRAVVYRVPRLLEPLLGSDRPGDQAALVVAAARALERLWWKSEHSISEPEALELFRLARNARLADVVVPVAHAVGSGWLMEHRYGEARSLYEEALAAGGQDYRLIGGLGRSVGVLGDGTQAHELLTAAVAVCPSEEIRGRLFYLQQLADLLNQRGEVDEALRILREEVLPAFERLGDVGERAVALGRVADILYRRGELDEALRIRREEELPVFERLGDVRARAVTLGQVADILSDRGEVDEALRIFRDEVLPPIRRLQDLYSLKEVLVRLGLLSSRLKQTDQAIQYLREAQDLAARLNDEILEDIQQLLEYIAKSSTT